MSPGILSRMKSAFLKMVNTVPGVIACRDHELQWWRAVPGFCLDEKHYACFCHAYNCGFPPSRMSERGVELAIADRWLNTTDETPIVEIGAVTPYYWPSRVKRVVDPVDDHPLVSHRRSLFQVDLSGMDVLALSTLEHVGYGDYIPSTPEESPRSAFEKIANESRRYLLTVPYGFNPDSDAFFFGEDIPTARYMTREPLSNTWRQVRTAAEAQRPYGARGVFAPNAWANGLAIIERSSVR